MNAHIATFRQRGCICSMNFVKFVIELKSLEKLIFIGAKPSISIIYGKTELNWHNGN